MTILVHAEIRRNKNWGNATPHLTSDEIEKRMLAELKTVGSINAGGYLDSFNDKFLNDNVSSIQFSDLSELVYTTEGSPDDLKVLPLDKIRFQFHVYQLEEDDFISNENDDLNSTSNYYLLPHISFQDVWENLIFDTNIKEDLLEYVYSSIMYSRHKVNTNIISWNKVILLYGPPGTGKTSLCISLAQKLSIRLSHYYQSTEFIEIKSQTLLSKYFSESGKLVTRMFAKIRSHLEHGDSLVCVLIDEIESLTYSRKSCASGGEPSDTVRVVNIVLTELDSIRKYPNVLILTTSNLKSSIDVAFVDRADLQIYVGMPSTFAIYKIFVSCIQELIKVGIIKQKAEFLSVEYIMANEHTGDNPCLSYKLLSVAKTCQNFSGRILRRIPILAYTVYSRSDEKNVANFINAMDVAIRKYKITHKDMQDLHR